MTLSKQDEQIHAARNIRMILRYLVGMTQHRPVTIKSLAKRYGISGSRASAIIHRWFRRIGTQAPALIEKPDGTWRWATGLGDLGLRMFVDHFVDRAQGRVFVRALWMDGLIENPRQHFARRAARLLPPPPLRPPPRRLTGAADAEFPL